MLFNVIAFEIFQPIQFPKARGDGYGRASLQLIVCNCSLNLDLLQLGVLTGHHGNAILHYLCVFLRLLLGFH